MGWVHSGEWGEARSTTRPCKEDLALIISTLSTQDTTHHTSIANILELSLYSDIGSSSNVVRVSVTLNETGDVMLNQSAIDPLDVLVIYFLMSLLVLFLSLGLWVGVTLLITVCDRRSRTRALRRLETRVYYAATTSNEQLPLSATAAGAGAAGAGSQSSSSRVRPRSIAC